MGVMSFTDAARRLHSGGDFFAPCPPADRTTSTDWNAIVQRMRTIPYRPDHLDRIDGDKRQSMEQARFVAS